MKKFFLFILSLCFTVMLNAQVSRTVNITTAGTLSSSSIAGELAIVTNLTITGTIDARDFKTMRDNMPVLAVIDISGVSIAAYSGTEGTVSSGTYPFNEVPSNAFTSKTSLKSVIIPSSATSLGISVFAYCSGLTSVNFPATSSLTSIGNSAFYQCSSLTSVTIPSLVTFIGTYAFIYCTSLTSVNFAAPSSLTSIGDGAFYQCQGLTSVTIPSSVTTVGASVFYACSKLKSVNFSAPSSLTTIENNAFIACIALKSVDFSATSLLTSIGYSAFSGCASLTSINIPSSVTSIGYNSFINCTGLESVNFSEPSSLTSIESSVFQSCTSLTSINIPSSVTSIEGYSFYGCTMLTSITIPPAVTSIKTYAFGNCTGLNSFYAQLEPPVNLSSSPNVFSGVHTNTCVLHVPYGISALYAAADQWEDFTNREEMAEFKVSATQARIESAGGSSASIGLTTALPWTALSNQSWLTVSPASGSTNATLVLTAEENTSYSPRFAKVTVSAAGVPTQTISITQLGVLVTVNNTAGGLFAALNAAQRSQITRLTITGNIDARDFKTMRDDMPMLAEIDISNATIADYTGTSGTTTGSVTYPANTVPQYAFNSKASLTSIILPSTATSIDIHAFHRCSGLSDITIPSSVTSIGYQAFYQCTKLTSVTIPTSVTSIEHYAFQECTGLTSVNFSAPSSLTSMGTGAFIYCSGLTSVTIPSSLTSIPIHAFYQCTGLTSVIIPSSVTSIEEAAFYQCYGLTSVNIPSSVTSIGQSAFSSCTGLTSVNIPSSVKSLGANAFAYCSGLTSVTFSTPSSLTSVGAAAFYYCTKLASVILPESVTSIGSSAFSYCTVLSKVSIPSTVTFIGEYSFNNSTGLTSIFAYPATPVNLIPSVGVFLNVNKTTCKLFVPYGTKVLYAAANQWKDFTTILEIPTAGSIAASQTICYNTTPSTITSTSPGLVMTGATVSYRWEYSTDGIVWSSTGATNATFAPEALTQTTNFHRITVSTLDGFSWESVPTEPVTITVQTSVTVGAIAANQTICFGTVPSPLTSTEAGTGSGTISYEWQNNASGSYVTIADATSAGYSPPSLTATKSYQRRTVSVLNGINCFSSYTTPVTITVQALVTAGTIATNQTICIGTVPSPLTSMEAGTGSGTISYEWQTNASGSYVTIADATSAGYSPPSLTATTSYQRRTVSALNGVNCFSSYTTPVTITVQTSVMAGTIATNQTICYGTVPSPLSSTAAGTGSGTISYEWQTNASGSYVTIAEATSAGYSPPSLTATTSYQRRTVSALNGVKCYSSYTEPVTITVTPTVTIAAFSPATSIRCQGEGTVTTTTTASHNSAAIVYSLDGASLTGGNTINSSTGAVTYAAGWSGATTITASAEGCNGPATTTHVVTTNALPTAFDVTGGGTYCSVSEGYPVGLAGSEVGVNYTLYMDNIAIDPPGTVAGTGAAIDFGNQPTGTFTVKGTNACGTTNMTGPAVIIEKPSPTLNMPIVNSTCSGEDIYFSAFGLLIEVTNIIHFKITKDGVTTTGSKEVESNVDGVATFIGEAYEPGSYTYEITSIEVNGCTSNFEDKITNFDVNSNLPASVSIAAVPSGAICSGTPVTYTATPINGGTPEYQWYKGSTPVGLNSETYTDNGTIAGSITVIMTSTLGCVNSPTATSNAISLTIASPGQWLGVTSDWNTESNWCGGVPSSATNIKIPSGVTQPIIGVLTNASCNNIDIAGGTSFTIASNATGTGSLIISGIVSGAGSASVQRYMTTDRWHIVSSPVAGQSIANFLTSNGNVATDDVGARGMMDYDPDLNDWNNYFTNSTLGNLETGKGFSMRTNANSAVTFSGTLNAGTLSTTGMASGLWNCVGNPYTSAIGINTGSSSSSNFLATNASNLDPSYGAIYIWDQPDENNGTWGIYTIISNTPGFGSDAAFDVQQGQAFMVKMNSALTATSVGYTQAMQLHNPGLALKSGNSVWPAIKLEASVSGQTSSTLIAFNNRMTKGLDVTYDAGLLRGSADLVIYSRLVEDNGIPFTIQALPANEFSTMIIPIGVESKTGGELVFSSKFIDLPADCQVILEDKLSGTFTDLSISDYRTEIEANSSSSDRFLLHTSSLSTGLIDNNADNLSAYAFRNIEIRINGQVSNQAIATLYDVQGRVILVKTLEEVNLNVVRTPNIKTAIYMLSVNDKGKLQRFKIPVKE